jgi:hypothetical protein
MAEVYVDPADALAAVKVHAANVIADLLGQVATLDAYATGLRAQVEQQEQVITEQRAQLARLAERD